MLIPRKSPCGEPTCGIRHKGSAVVELQGNVDVLLSRDHEAPEQATAHADFPANRRVKWMGNAEFIRAGGNEIGDRSGPRSCPLDIDRGPVGRRGKRHLRTGIQNTWKYQHEKEQNYPNAAEQPG